MEMVATLGMTELGEKSRWKLMVGSSNIGCNSNCVFSSKIVTAQLLPMEQDTH